MKNRHNRWSESDHDLAAATLKWASTAGASAPLPAQRPLLGFRDPQIERAYLDTEHRRNRKYYAVCMSIVTIIVASFIWTDPWLLPPDAIHTFRMARIYLLVPLSALLTINAVWITNSIAWTRQCAALLVLFELIHPLLLLINGVSVFQYLELGMLQVIFGTFLFFGLPLRWSLPIAGIFGVTFAASVLHVEADASPFVNFCVDFVAYAFSGGVAAYRYENASRREFIAQLHSRKEYTERLAAAADRRRWLEMIAAFLRHELKNAMTGISTSIEMADRLAPHSDAGKYLDRGRRSVQYMHQILAKVADATSLESALAQHEFESIDLSSLILDRIDDFRRDAPDRKFSTDIEHHVHILGHGDSLVQMLDKLINNALEHGDRDCPISIELRSLAESSVLTVSDTGDPLPADTTQIFEPFVSRKVARAGTANLGLGLFVARAIAINHGGNVSAVPLDDAVGARFVVRLPPMAQTALSVEPTISTPSLGANSVEARVDL
jgi:signal transduction histidine kinase